MKFPDPLRIALTAVLFLSISGCSLVAPPLPPQAKVDPRAARSASPATMNCIQNNGRLEIVKTPEGEKGYCVLPSGKRCDEWEMFRGNCPTRTVNANMKFPMLF